MLKLFKFIITSKGNITWKGVRIEYFFAAELDVTKILVPRQPQDTLSVSTEFDGKAKQLCFLCDQPLGAPICLFLLF